MNNRPTLYNPAIMKLYRTTPHRGTVENATFTTEKVSPSCGDRVVFSGIVKDGILTDIKFCGEGSMVTQVVASLLCDLTLHKPTDFALQMGATELEDLLSTQLNLQLGPTRFQVVLFVLDVLQQGLAGYDGSCPGCARITHPD